MHVKGEGQCKETDTQIEIDKVQTAQTILSVGPNRRLNFYGDSTEGRWGWGGGEKKKSVVQTERTTGNENSVRFSNQMLEYPLLKEKI